MKQPIFRFAVALNAQRTILRVVEAVSKEAAERTAKHLYGQAAHVVGK